LTAAVSADEPTVDKEREGEDVSMEREVAGFSLLSILDLVVEVRREMGRDRELEGDCSFVSILDLVGADEDGSVREGERVVVAKPAVLTFVAAGAELLESGAGLTLLAVRVRESEVGDSPLRKELNLPVR